MTQYFFDLITPKSLHRDCNGQRLDSVERAREQAVLIAMDWGCSQGENPPSLQVLVRDAVGELLFAVPAPLTGSLAA
jgi:hypothetical protein